MSKTVSMILLFVILTVSIDLNDGILQLHSFDPSLKKCMAFLNFPCKSKSNIYPSLRECQADCKKKVSPVLGHEKYKPTTFFFAPSTKTCTIFGYDKCRNNSNLFTTPNDCSDACANVKKTFKITKPQRAISIAKYL